MTKFVKGQSGNRRGRPKGTISHKKLREAILKEAPDIVTSMIGLAKGGDTTAAKILLDRVMAPMKAGDSLINIPLTGEMTNDAKKVLTAVGSSELTPNQGQSILLSIASLARVIEVDDLLNRVAKLEKSNVGY